MNLWLRLTCLMLLCCSLPGCGGDELPLGRVSGVVTLDGEALPNAWVVFSPQEAGHPAFGQTNEKGEYTLTYKGMTNRAVVGDHAVGITMHNPYGEPESPEGEDSKPVSKMPVESLPAKYNSQSELRVTVKSGSNTLNFELQSQ